MSTDRERPESTNYNNAIYDKCPYISITSFPNKMTYANNADQIRLLLKEQSDLCLHCSPFRQSFGRIMHKQNLGKNVRHKVFEILGQLLYMELFYDLHAARDTPAVVRTHTLW